MRPFLLYHWSPVSRRKGILKHGLCPKKKSRDGSWRPPYICFSRYPNVAWSLSATHDDAPKEWDLWVVWSDFVGKYKTMNNARRPRAQYYMTEYRGFQRIPTRHVVFIASRTFKGNRFRRP